MLTEYRRHQPETGGDTVGRSQTAGGHPGERRERLRVGRHHHHPGHQAADEETGRQLPHDRSLLSPLLLSGREKLFSLEIGPTLYSAKIVFVWKKQFTYAQILNYKYKAKMRLQGDISVQYQAEEDERDRSAGEDLGEIQTPATNSSVLLFLSDFSSMTGLLQGCLGDCIEALSINNLLGIFFIFLLGLGLALTIASVEYIHKVFNPL